MKIRYLLLCAAALMAALMAPRLTDAEDQQHGPFLTFENPTGIAATYNTAGKIDRDNPFFQKLGTNGRSCDTCHQASDGWTVIPAHIRDRFDATMGTDPIFRLVDGANSPNADVSTVAARRDCLQHAAHQRADPDRHRHSRQCRVRAGRASTTRTVTRVRVSSRCSGGRCPRPTSNFSAP